MIRPDEGKWYQFLEDCHRKYNQKKKEKIDYSDYVVKYNSQLIKLYKLQEK